MKIDGQTVTGATRPKRSLAQQDLMRAQRCKTREDMKAFLRTLQGAQLLANPPAVSHHLGLEPPGAHHVAATSCTAKEPGSASSIAGASCSMPILSDGRSAAQKKTDRLEH